MRLSLRIIAGLLLYLMLPLLVGAAAFVELSAPKNSVPRPRPTLNTATAIRNRVRAEDFYRTGTSAYRAGDYSGAAEKFRAALALVPENGSWHNSLGLALAGMGRVDDAEGEYQKAIAADPNLAEAYYNLGGAYQQRGELDKAQSAYKGALALEPGLALAHNNLGTLYMGRGQRSLARDEFAQAIDLDPALVRAHMNLGVVLGDLSDWSGAATEFEKVTRLDGQSSEAFYFLGLARARKGQVDGARRALQTAIMIGANSVWGSRAQGELDRLPK